VAVTGLGAAAALHAAWALGSTWPADDPDQLADLVAGRRPFPGTTPSWVMAGLLGTSAAIAATRSGLVRSPLGSESRLIRTGAVVVASALLARGAAGLAVSGLDLYPTTPAFRRWNLRLYSPFCVGLGGAVMVASRR
jgi:hypothetical protein